MNTQHLRLNRFTSPLNIGEISVASLYRQNYYLAAKHRRDFGCFIIQTELPRRWTLTRFSLPYYTDRFTPPLNIGEIFFALLYRQNYLAAEHRRDFLCLIIPTDLPRRWTSPRFSLRYYTDRVTSPLNIGEISVASLYRQNYFTAEHRRDFGCFIIQTEYYLAAEHQRDFGCFIIQTELPRRWTSGRFWLYISVNFICIWK